MKIRLLLTLAGLAIGFAFPTLAQEQNAVDPEVRQQIQATYNIKRLWSIYHAKKIRLERNARVW